MNKEPEKQKHPSDKSPEANIPFKEQEEQKNDESLPASTDAENDADNGPDLSPKMVDQPKPVKPKKNPVENKVAKEKLTSIIDKVKFGLSGESLIEELLKLGKMLDS